MQTYLMPPHGEPDLLRAAPRTREEAVALVAQDGSMPSAVRSFRIVSLDEFDASPVESCEVEIFGVGVRDYGGGRRGLIEASASAHQVSTEFSPTRDDIALWLNALRNCWLAVSPDCSRELSQVNDFRVLQHFDGARLLSSITWNEADADIAFRMPNTIDVPPHLWGDALLPDVGLLYEALRVENFFSSRK